MDGPQAQGAIAFWLALNRAPAIRNESLRRLINELKNPEAIFHADVGVLTGFGLSSETVDYIQHPLWEQVEKDLEWCKSPGNHVVTIADENYPEILKATYDPPLILYLSGNPGILNTLQISIVGSRRPTSDGRRNAREFAAALARLGLTITSGLAVGLDSAAHEGALDANGRTIAVLGSGLNRIYPKENIKLTERIIDKHGAVISELPPEYRAMPSNFPRRNRIISGLSLGTVVVEAAENSGSLITARLALEQGREVFALPGSIHNPLAKGCHALIRQGAKLTETIDDILEEIGPLAYLVGNSGQGRQGDGKKIPALDEVSKLLLDNIGSRPVSLDSLVEVTKLSASALSARLLELELSGVIVSLPGGGYTRVGF
jgi:DNA processing protein